MPEKVMDLKSEVTDRSLFPSSQETQGGLSAADPTPGNTGRLSTWYFPQPVFHS